ncbi:MAG: hypothetical protein GY795_21025 [Desulfobacterales bacterium]|nr:hypothetical protein [Desulfobacterales bacterium]
MGKQDLRAFINAKRQMVSEEVKIDWEQIKTEWLENLNKLYENIKSWLEEFDIRINYSDIELNEESLGIYNAKKMIIAISDEQILIEPVGTRIIGAKGRVDMKGKSGKITILLVPEESKGPSIKASVSVGDEKEEKKISIPKKWAWKLATRPPAMKYIELDGDSFSDALLEAIGG